MASSACCSRASHRVLELPVAPSNQRDAPSDCVALKAGARVMLSLLLSVRTSASPWPHEGNTSKHYGLSVAAAWRVLHNGVVWFGSLPVEALASHLAEKSLETPQEPAYPQVGQIMRTKSVWPVVLVSLYFQLPGSIALKLIQLASMKPSD